MNASSGTFLVSDLCEHCEKVRDGAGWRWRGGAAVVVAVVARWRGGGGAEGMHFVVGVVRKGVSSSWQLG